MPRIGRIAVTSLTLSIALFAGACATGTEPILVAGGGEQVIEPATIEVIGADDVTVEVGQADAVETTITENPAVPTTTADNASTSSSSTPLVIYDTDMGPDVDDVLALAMLHSYEKQGRIELAAVTISRDSTAGAKYSDAVNHFYGRPDIPIGVYRGGTDEPYDDGVSFISRADSWPQDIGSQGRIQDGYKIIRQVLADAGESGREVIIIQTGFSGNTSALMNSGGDDISGRSGVDLAKDHVKLLSIMAGTETRRFVEFNVENDLSSARNLFAKWPAPLALSPFELGNAIHYPYSSITRDFGWVDRHPVREAYEFRDLSWHQDSGRYYNMKSWDLTSVMYAIEPPDRYFYRSDWGLVRMDGSGYTSFQAGEGIHQMLDRGANYSQERKDLIINRMIELVSDRP